MGGATAAPSAFSASPAPSPTNLCWTDSERPACLCSCTAFPHIPMSQIPPSGPAPAPPQGNTACAGPPSRCPGRPAFSAPENWHRPGPSRFSRDGPWPFGCTYEFVGPCPLSIVPLHTTRNHVYTCLSLSHCKSFGGKSPASGQSRTRPARPPGKIPACTVHVPSCSAVFSS